MEGAQPPPLVDLATFFPITFHKSLPGSDEARVQGPRLIHIAPLPADLGALLKEDTDLTNLFSINHFSFLATGDPADAK